MIFRFSKKYIYLFLLFATFYFFCSCKDQYAENQYIPPDFQRLSSIEKSEYISVLTDKSRYDHISAYYKEFETREAVLAFFSEITKSEIIATKILDQSIESKVPPALAFALAFEESCYNPKACNFNADSVDRGLFQLNSKAFPGKSPEYLFDISNNIKDGLNVLSKYLEQGGNEIVALAMYNSGYSRVSRDGTPKRTLGYIYNIISYRSRLEALFEAQVIAKMVPEKDKFPAVGMNKDQMFFD